MSHIQKIMGSSIGPFLWHLHLGLYNRFFTFIPSFSIRALILRLFYRLELGHHTYMEMGIRLISPHKIKIGDHSIVHFDAILDGRCRLEIGKCVDVGHQVNIFTLEHNIDDPYYRTQGGKVVIGDYAIIGGRSIILPGVAIGEGAVVASGAVVTKDVPPYTMVAGVPAKAIRERNKELLYKLNYRGWFQ